MKKMMRILGAVCLFVAVLQATAEQKDPCHYSTEGKEFWFGFMQNRQKGNVHYLEITVTSRLGAQFTLAYGPNETSIGGTYAVGPNSSVTVPIDFSLVESMGSETIENKGIHLVSTNPVSVYAFNYRTQSSDVAVIYPTESLGREYFAMCYTPRQNNNNETNTEFLIVAAENNTTVQITPTVDTDKQKKANVMFTVKLNKGQSYQVQSMNQIASGQGDLTGSYISSDKPVAFFSGSKATPITTSGSSYDHLYEQIPPTSTWGREFYMVPLKQRTKDTYRVLAAENGTSVYVEALNRYVTLNRGQYFEFDLSGNQASKLLSSKRVLLAQYCRSQSVDGGQGVGDPFMIILSPVTQKINDVTFVAYQSNLIKTIFYVNIIIHTSEVGNITLDGQSISQHFNVYPDGKYSYAQVPISGGSHRLLNTNEEGGFLAFVYGFGNSGNTESYGYGVGFNLDIQLDLGLSYDLKDTLVVCKGAKIPLDAGNYFDHYLWNTGDTIPLIEVSKEGLYSITAWKNNGCTKSDQLYIRVEDPKISLGKDTSSCGPGKIILDAGKGFDTYQWQDGSKSQTFTVNKSGFYSVTGTSRHGCKASDTIYVEVFDVPVVKIEGDTLHCGNFTAELNVQVTDADPSIWNYSGAAKWTSTSADLQFKNSRPDGVTLEAKKPGYYQIDYTLTTTDGCRVSDSFSVGFFDIPESDFSAETPESTDKCSSYHRIVKYTGGSGPSAKYTWNFGGLMVLDTIGSNHFRVSIGANNPQRTISLVVEEHGCTSPMTSKTIGVNPTFRFWADDDHGCDSLCVNFFSEVSIMDKVSYYWSFGDGAVSNLQNPVHCYRDTGKYDVSLLVTNEIDGCRNGSTEKEMIKIFRTPRALISAETDLCFGDTVSFEYLNKTAFSNCQWFAKGNELISAENTSARYWLKEQISQVGFVVEENGCSCDTLKVLVKRKPHFDFEASETGVCLPFPVSLKAIAKDNGLQFKWSVDTASQIQGDSLIHLFAEPGDYSVTLEAFSDITGCSSILTKPAYLQVYPLPVAGFTQNYPVATLEHPDISFQNHTEGAVSYLWDFGDGVTSVEKNPTHNYADIGEYSIFMQAVSDFGCIDTLSSRVKIIPFSFYAPNAFRPDSDIPENRIFLPIREGIDPGKYRFEIFNRVGSVVFSASDPDRGWNGKMPNGTEGEPGVYVWVVKYADIQGYEHLQKGTVMLVR